MLFNPVPHGWRIVSSVLMQLDVQEGGGGRLPFSEVERGGYGGDRRRAGLGGEEGGGL